MMYGKNFPSRCIGDRYVSKSIQAVLLFFTHTHDFNFCMWQLCGFKNSWSTSSPASLIVHEHLWSSHTPSIHAACREHQRLPRYDACTVSVIWAETRHFWKRYCRVWPHLLGKCWRLCQQQCHEHGESHVHMLEIEVFGTLPATELWLVSWLVWSIVMQVITVFHCCCQQCWQLSSTLSTTMFPITFSYLYGSTVETHLHYHAQSCKKCWHTWIS